MKRVVSIFSLLLIAASDLHAVRLKDIASLQGVRENQLIGYGLIVGLDGTGDKSGTEFTIQSLASMLRNLGIGVDPSQINVKNVAAVIATAKLPPFARSGSRIDVLVSSLGDAASLQGGTLLLTPLRAPNGEIYAVAQGPVSIGGFSAASGGASVQKSHATVAQVANGALVEREVPFDFSGMKELIYNFGQPDFTTARRAAIEVNQTMGVEIARARDSGTLAVAIPAEYQNRLVELVSLVENIPIVPDAVAKVVINERTGSVVVGQEVRLSTVAISHGSLSISIQPQFGVSQPDALSDGQTVVVNEPTIDVEDPEKKLIIIPESVNIGDLVKALNAMGVTPRDLIAILQAIKAAGALQANLEII